MNYADITDPSNPFEARGLSLEVQSMLFVLQKAKRTGLDVVCTSTTDHPEYTNAGNLSRHRMEGTNGLGLAIDDRMRQRGTSPGLHRPAWDLFLPWETQLHEGIYAFAPYNIKAGRRVQPYAVSDHEDHNHHSVNKGTLLTTMEETMQFAQVVDWLDNVTGNGAWGLLRDGGIITVGGAPFYGSYAKGPAEGWEARKLFHYRGGYMFVNDDLQEYHFPRP